MARVRHSLGAVGRCRHDHIGWWLGSAGGPDRAGSARPVALDTAPPGSGDGMVRLGGELADGVLLNWCTPERVGAARTLVTEAAEGAGRDPAAVTVVVYVRTCLGLEEAAAMAALKDMAGRYAAIPHYRRQ